MRELGSVCLGRSCCRNRIKRSDDRALGADLYKVVRHARTQLHSFFARCGQLYSTRMEKRTTKQKRKMIRQALEQQTILKQMLMEHVDPGCGRCWIFVFFWFACMGLRARVGTGWRCCLPCFGQGQVAWFWCCDLIACVNREGLEVS